MKMGIKEFRERLSEVVRKGEPIVVTSHGKVLGTFAPLRPKDPEQVRRAAESIRRWQEEMKAKGVDLEAELAAMGLDPWGVPLDDRAGG
jgi:antitoxin (DNA-binding transcriptional repressor) of toxin-antitoxin stability system